MICGGIQFSSSFSILDANVPHMDTLLSIIFEISHLVEGQVKFPLFAPLLG